MKQWICLAALLTAWLPAWAINKCTMPDGKVQFQEAPCAAAAKAEALRVRPASGDAPAPARAADTPSGAAPLTETQRLQAQIAQTQRERRKWLLEVRLVPDALHAVASQRSACDSQVRALQAKKLAANNNLAGATWEQSISTEMGAVAARCDTQARELREARDALVAECHGLGGCR